MCPFGAPQGSVVLLLVFVLLMENPRRGLFFGYKAPGLRTAVDVTKRYHGYLFSWAVIYTFWYHPMEDTGGHILGTFLYIADHVAGKSVLHSQSREPKMDDLYGGAGDFSWRVGCGVGG